MNGKQLCRRGAGASSGQLGDLGWGGDLLLYSTLLRHIWDAGLTSRRERLIYWREFSKRPQRSPGEWRSGMWKRWSTVVSGDQEKRQWAQIEAQNISSERKITFLLLWVRSDWNRLCWQDVESQPVRIFRTEHGLGHPAQLALSVQQD